MFTDMQSIVQQQVERTLFHSRRNSSSIGNVGDVTWWKQNSRQRKDNITKEKSLNIRASNLNNTLLLRYTKSELKENHREICSFNKNPMYGCSTCCKPNASKYHRTMKLLFVVVLTLRDYQLQKVLTLSILLWSRAVFRCSSIYRESATRIYPNLEQVLDLSPSQLEFGTNRFDIQ